MYQSSFEGRFTEVDPILAAMLGYDSAGEMIESIRDIGEELYVQPGVRQQLVTRLMSSSAICNFETQVYRKDGEVLWVSEYSRLFRDQGGRVTGFRGAFADISLYRNLLEQQNDSNLHVGRELAALTQTLSNVPPRRILVKDGTSLKFMDTSKVISVRADRDYVHVHSVDSGPVMARDRISDVERRLGGSQFVRISKSALVNVDYLREMRINRRGNYEILLHGGERLVSGPTYRDTIQRLLERFS